MEITGVYFKLRFPTINDFCCQSGSSKFLGVFFFPGNYFPSLELLVKKVLPFHTQVLSINFINVTILLKLVLASAFQELSKWHGTIGNAVLGRTCYKSVKTLKFSTGSPTQRAGHLLS